MRPGGPGQGYPQAGGYPSQGPLQQDPGRYYTPGPGGEFIHISLLGPSH